MFRNYSLLCIFTCLLTGIVARESIVGGYTANIETFPYQISVHIPGQLHICGGGIINERFVLTAAKCLVNRTYRLHNNQILIVAGTHELYETGPPAVIVRVEKVFFPSDFLSTQFEHGDIAVLRLVESLPLEDHRNLGKIELPKHHQTGERAKVIGFGWNHYRRNGNGGIGSTDGKLRYAMADVLRGDECERDFPPHVIQTNIHLCATIYPPMYATSTTSFGACIGDLGNPLVENGRIIGILSRHTPHCDEQHSSAIYTRVSSYVGLIHEIMKHGYAPQVISFDLQPANSTRF